MKSKILSTILVAFMVCSASIQTQAQASDVELSSAKSKLDCPDVKLLRHATKEQRKLTVIGSKLNVEPFFLSKHYCFAYIRVFVGDDTSQNATYTINEVSTIVRNYRAVFRQLQSDESRLAFIHLYVQAVSQRAIVYPDAQGNLANITISIKGGVKFRSGGFFHGLIKKEDDHRLMLDKLADIQANPPTAKDNPVLMALVLQVLDVEKLLSTESAQDQLMESKWH